jgi:hypothetical protein
MPSAGDSNNLRPNLQTVAALAKKIGAKLSYDKETGQFSIQEAGKLQSLARTFSRGQDSIENEEYFGAPIRELFAAARVQKENVASALEGLRSLRNSYPPAPIYPAPASDAVARKRKILEDVIEDAELGVRKEKASGISLRQSYEKYVIFGFAQEMFLLQSEPGVCYSLTVHWARRILMGKTHFGISKKTLEQVSLPTVDAQQKKRMMRKVDREIRPLHAALKEYNKQNPYDRPGVGIMTLAGSDRFAKYGDISIGNILRLRQDIEAEALGSHVIGELLRVAENRTDEYTIFLVNFENVAQAHTIGFHLNGTALHFFDPNCGEFAFQGAFRTDRERFLDDWWRAFYVISGRAAFNAVKLEGVKMKPGKEGFLTLP